MSFCRCVGLRARPEAVAAVVLQVPAGRDFAVELFQGGIVELRQEKWEKIEREVEICLYFSSIYTREHNQRTLFSNFC